VVSVPVYQHSDKGIHLNLYLKYTSKHIRYTLKVKHFASLNYDSNAFYISILLYMYIFKVFQGELHFEPLCYFNNDIFLIVIRK